MNFPEEARTSYMNSGSKLRLNYKKMYLDGLIDINLNHRVEYMRSFFIQNNIFTSEIECHYYG